MNATQSDICSGNGVQMPIPFAIEKATDFAAKVRICIATLVMCTQAFDISWWCAGYVCIGNGVELVVWSAESACKGMGEP